MKKSLVVGMGIGQLYKSVLLDLNHQVITVDPDIRKNADLPTVESAILAHGPFDTVHICTPNFTHELIARKVAPHAEIVFVEKPGVRLESDWKRLVADFPDTRFMMVKNNQWRDNIPELKELTASSRSVFIQWVNKDRVPNPGTWFTTKDLAFGGVSRDLMPHLLSLFMVLNPDYRNANWLSRFIKQHWELDDLTNTDYGNVNPDGTYDVDDTAGAVLLSNGRMWSILANWRNTTNDSHSIVFEKPDGTEITVELGLCPEYAYKNMIATAIEKYNDQEFWADQLTQDLWLHHQMEQFQIGQFK